MPTRKSPRKGSLQFWPRKRARKILPRVNWNAISSGKNLKGMIGYKAGMVSVLVKDNTPDSMTKGKQIIVPSTIIEIPGLKILGVRFYKNGVVAQDILSNSLDKELKSKLKLPKNYSKKIEEVKSEDYDDISVVAYSQVKKTGIKKTPDIAEFGLVGTKEEKFNFVKDKIGKDILASEILEDKQLVDIRGLTRGKGLQGPVKRFGIHLKDHKSEKGQRRPGSIGPWHPARVTFRVPMAGQLGMFTRAHYNFKIIKIGGKEDPIKDIKNYGNTKSDYILVRGSVQGASKRQLIVSFPLRESKKQKKKDYEFVRVLK